MEIKLTSASDEFLALCQRQIKTLKTASFAASVLVSGLWAVGSGQWAVGSGQWAVGSGQ